jgi:hypothetical protein
MVLLDKLFGKGPKPLRAYGREAHPREPQRDFDGATALMDQAIRLDPHSAEAHCGRGAYSLPFPCLKRIDRR